MGNYMPVRNSRKRTNSDASLDASDDGSMINRKKYVPYESEFTELAKSKVILQFTK